MKLATSAKRVPPDNPKAGMQTWSTGELHRRERFSYWRDAICRSVFNISIEAAPEPEARERVDGVRVRGDTGTDLPSAVTTL